MRLASYLCSTSQDAVPGVNHEPVKLVTPVDREENVSQPIGRRQEVKIPAHDRTSLFSERFSRCVGKYPTEQFGINRNNSE